MKSIDKRYINSVLYREVNAFAHRDTSARYKVLLTNTRLVEYFNRYYKFNEIPGMIKRLQRSRYFDKSFLDKIKKRIHLARDKYLDNLRSAVFAFSRGFKSQVKDEHISFALKQLEKQVFNGNYSVRFPTLDEVLSKQNFKASMGLPFPWKKKSEFKLVTKDLISRLIRGNLSTADILNAEHYTSYSAAFKRTQITSSDVKERLVFAVGYVVACIESFYDITFKDILGQMSTSNFIHGKTQVEISQVVSSVQQYHTYSFDAVSFDHTIPQDVLTLSYLCLEHVLHLNEYHGKIFRFIRNYILTLPLFHPSVDYTRRARGLSSGSGLTSTIGSFSMFIMHSITVFKLCRVLNLDPFKEDFKIIVSSDDSMVCFTRSIPTKLYLDIMKQTFDLELELEQYSKPGVNRAFFLGSDWKSGKPYRNINRLFARIAFGAGNFPKMSEEQLFASRCFDILGNTSNFSDIWSSFKLGKMPSRVFRFLELLDYSNQLRIRDKMAARKGYRNIGIFETLDKQFTTNLDQIWMTR